MRRWSGLVAVFVLACGQPAQPAAKLSAGASPVAIQSQSPLASPSALASPSPSVSPTASDLPLTAVGFSCRLPIQISTIGDGYLTFPGGTFTPDPASQFVYDQSRQTYRSTQQPQLTGSVFWQFYDRPQKRWLPAPRRAVYPDGSSYAYVTAGNTQTVHVVDVASGAEQTYVAPHPVAAEVFDYEADGIYLASNLESGVWLLNAQTGTERLLTSEKIVWAVAGGSVWLGKLTAPQPISIYPDTLVEFNLTRGDETVWFHREGQIVYLLGLKAIGEPVLAVLATAGGEEVWVGSSPIGAERIFSGPRIFDTAPVSDSHGIWLGTMDSGMYLYTEGARLQQVSATHGTPAGICA